MSYRYQKFLTLLLGVVMIWPCELPAADAVRSTIYDGDCSGAVAAACPSLLGDACELCAGKHYAKLEHAGCNATSIEYACHHVSRGAAIAWLEELSDWIVGLDIGTGTLSEANGRSCSPCTTAEDRNHIFVNGNLARVVLATWRLQEGTLEGSGNETLLQAGLAWCDSLCDQQAPISTSTVRLRS